MKKLVSMVVVIVLVAVFSYAETKIGIVNSQMVLKNSKGGIAFMKKMSAIDKKMSNKMRTMTAEIKKIEKELASPALNSAARERKAELLQNKKTAAKRYYEDAKANFQKKYQKEMQKLLKDIMPVIQNVGKSKGFTVIMEMQNVAYYDKAVEVTADVIKAYDAVFNAKK